MVFSTMTHDDTFSEHVRTDFSIVMHSIIRYVLPLTQLSDM